MTDNIDTKRQLSSPPHTSLLSFEKKSTWYNLFLLTRLHKFPLGNILLFWACAWGVTMAAYRTSLEPQLFTTQVILFLLRSTLVHSAGCVYNDIIDRDIDGKIERTKLRPLVTGVVSLSSAWILTLVLTASAFALLLLCNERSIIYGIVELFPIAAFYPWMKRWTWWPQAWLGLAMNWGYIIAWSSVTDDETLAVPIFFIGTICWSIVYDTMYAYQDREDDIKAGMKSTAVLFGSWVKPILAAFAAGFVICMIVAGSINNQGPAYFIISCGGAAVHFVGQLYTWDINHPTQGGEMFKANHHLGYIVWAGMLVDYYFKVRA